MNSLDKRTIEAEPAGTGKKLVIGLVDAVISFALTFFTGNYVLPNRFWNSITEDNPWLIVIIGYLIYRILTILTMQATIGMLITKTRFLNGDHESLSIPERTLAALFIPYKGTGLFDKEPSSA